MAAPNTPAESPSLFFNKGVTTVLLNVALEIESLPSVYSIFIFDKPPPKTTASGSKISITFARAAPKLLMKFSFHSGCAR